MSNTISSANSSSGNVDAPVNQIANATVSPGSPQKAREDAPQPQSVNSKFYTSQEANGVSGTKASADKKNFDSNQVTNEVLSKLTKFFANQSLSA